MSATIFGLIRHSLTLWNEEQRIQGHRNSPLSDAGREMALAWGRELKAVKWDRILASDLGRVQETVELINRGLHLPVAIEPRLREQDWGQWSGIRFPELMNRFADAVKNEETKGWHFRTPGGESRTELLARNLQALLEAADQWPGQTILIVCHEGVIKGLIYHLLGRKYLPREPKIFRGYQLHLLRMDQDQLLLSKMNHLELTGKP